MLTKRVVTSIILIVLICLAVVFKWFFAAAILAFTSVGLYEFFSMLESRGINSYKYFGIGLGLIIPISILWQFELTKKWELLFIVLGLFFLIVMQLKRRQSTGTIVGISTTTFGIIYVAWFFSFLIKIRMLPDGIGLLASILIITKLSDVGAYLIGSRFGSHALIPRVSPHKSVEGSIGGLFFSILGACVCKPMLNFTFFHLIFIGLLFGILAQLGDLSESLMKRDCQIKDSGKIFPGLGGVLDAIDSLLFTAPVFYFYMSTIVR